MLGIHTQYAEEYIRRSRQNEGKKVPPDKGRILLYR